MLAIVVTAIGFYVLYWVVRAAVRDGLRDADRLADGERQ